MCGISGIANWRIDDKEMEILKKMNRILAHRGPDEEGLFSDGRVALAHRRLSIIDPQGGQQPMIRQYGHKTFVITYNGELYNTLDLRNQLEAKGHIFFSNSDTEVLLVSYIQWGPLCLEKINGIFAFAIWDQSNQTLFLARDRLGVKPLFYAKEQETFLFASEIKALLAHPLIKPILTRDGLSEILALGPARTPGHGIFKNIRELRPGHFLSCSPSGITIQQYWTLKSQPHTDSLAKTIETVRELLSDAVKRQLVSDVPISTLLSGGLDSSALTALAKDTSEPLMTFSVSYQDNSMYFQKNSFEPDEDTPWAERMATHLSTEHSSISLKTTELMDSLLPSLVARDLPGMADIDGSLYLLSKEIKRKATVALSGECADEIFGGYPWLYKERKTRTFPWANSLKLREKLFTPEIFSIQEHVQNRYEEALNEVPYLKGEDPFAKQMRELTYLNLTRWMPTLLERKDRMSMAAGLEIRVPFCDHRLVEYAWNIPWEMKYHNQQPKGILREALRDYLPLDVIQRPKSPYPKTHHPEYTKNMQKWLLEIIHNSQSPLLSLINKEKVLEFILNGELSEPWFGQLMRGPQLLAYFIQLNCWLERYGVTIV